MWELGNKKNWASNNWFLSTVVLEKTLESPLDSKDIKQVNPKENQSWIFIGRTDTEVKDPILGPPGAKGWFTEKDTDARKDWKREEKGMTEDEMVGWHHWVNGHEFEQAPGIGDGVAKSWIWLSYWTELSLALMDTLSLCLSTVGCSNLLNSSRIPSLDLHSKEMQNRRNICIFMADSFCCTAETDTAV